LGISRRKFKKFKILERGEPALLGSYLKFLQELLKSFLE